ncbi:MAG TPA: putative zinc-binding protein, partial [Thermoleophilia bacterium]|nr:putative zinc-binding protein [Thermoleophilia bacterium]
MAVEKVTVFPCGGIGDPVSSVTRLAGYILADDLLPGRVELVSIPSVITGVPDSLELVQAYPVIALDGCGHRCGSNALNLVGIKPAARLFTPRVRSETKNAIGRRRPFPEVSGQRLAKDLAERAAVIARHMLEDVEYTFERQAISPSPDGLHDESFDIEEALGYEEMEAGCFHCSGMCAFKLEKDP